MTAELDFLRQKFASLRGMSDSELVHYVAKGRGESVANVARRYGIESDGAVDQFTAALAREGANLGRFGNALVGSRDGPLVNKMTAYADLNAATNPLAQESLETIVDDPSMARIGRWLGGGAIDTVPLIAEMVVGSKGGSLLARGLAKRGMAGASKAASTQAAKEAMVRAGIGDMTQAEAMALGRQAAAARTGGYAGGFAASLPSSTGNMLDQQRLAGKDYDLIEALMYGIPHAGLNVGLGLEGMASRLGAGARGVGSTREGVLRRMAEQGGKYAGQEAGQEVLQQYLENEAGTGEHRPWDYANAAALGAILGGTPGALTGLQRGHTREEMDNAWQNAPVWNNASMEQMRKALGESYAASDEQLPGFNSPEPSFAPEPQAAAPAPVDNADTWEPVPIDRTAEHKAALELGETDITDYDDWGKSELQKVLLGEPVAVVGDVAPRKGYKKVVEWAANLFKQQGGIAVSPEIGEVVIDERAAKDSLAHGLSRNKANAFPAVGSVITKGRLVHHTQNGKQDSFYITAPVKINGVDNIVTVLARKDENTQRMYLHSVIGVERLRAATGQSRADAGNTSGRSGKSEGTQREDIFSILHDALNFKREGVTDVGIPETPQPIH